MSKAHIQRALRIMAVHSAYGSNIMVSESEKTLAFLIPLKTGRLPEICERRSASLFAWESLTMQSSFRIHPTLPASGNPERKSR
jgi:hypothetical protein